MPRTRIPKTYVLKEDSKAMGAAQIMLGLIHGALGTLWFFLYNLEDEKHSVGPALMITSICYLYVSGLFFINSGSSSVIQGDPVTWQLVLVIVMNTISIFVSVIGLVIFGSGFSSFEEIGKDYIWSNMVGMMLLHISVLSTSSELIIAIIMVHRCKKAFKHVKAWDESLSSSEFSSESLSQNDLEKFSEDSRSKQVKRRRD